MPKPRKKEDVPVSLHPLSFEEALKKMLNTPPVNPPHQKKRKQRALKTRKVSDPFLPR
jgi:hypothetical protein